ncbi:MAG: histidine kinase, partial [Flavobacteriaceae bacterium]|nr:histidine kinase [Flavobacteriaceae bacterium]
MFKKLFFLLLLISSIGFSQASKIDSIQTILNNHQDRDSVRVSRLLDMSYLHRTSNLEAAHEYIKEALDIALEQNIKQQEGMARLYLAQNFKRQGNFTEGLKEILIATYLLDSTQAPRDQQLIANSELATFYEATKDYEKALAISLKTIETIKNDPLSPGKGRFYYDVGNKYMNLNQFENAERYYLKAVEICEQTDFTHGKMIMMGSLATTYKEMGRYNEAKSLIESSIHYFEENNQKTPIGANHQLLGQIATKEGKHQKSIEHYNKAKTIFDEVGNLEYSKNVHQSLYVAYSILEDHEKAKASNEVYILLRDSIESTKQNKLAADMKTKYETEKVEAQKDAALVKARFAESESKQNKNYFIGVSIITVLVLLSSLFFFGRLRERKKAELITLELRETQKRLALEKQYRDSELKALKSQMNPHFIFNALNSIQEYIVLNKKNLASDYLGKFADLIRTYLHHSDTGVISLQEEIDSLKTYLDLECLRFEDTLNYTFNVDNDLNTEVTHIPTMLLQPYIENALKHGLLHKKEDRKISVSFSKSEANNIQCTIIDNGVGREKSKEFQKKR